MNMKHFSHFTCIAAAFLITSCEEEPPPPPPAPPVEKKVEKKTSRSFESSTVLSNKKTSNRGNLDAGLGGGTLKRDEMKKKDTGSSFGSSSSFSRDGKKDSKTMLQGSK